jgi:uncharacterized protein (TIGR00730 family)
MIRTAAVYLGSATGRSQIFSDTAYRIGAELAHNGIRIVYGGACVGTMNSLADGALSAQGEIIGVFPAGFKGKKSYQEKNIEVCHRGLSELIEVEDMSQRKKVMEQMSDCCIALPGSYGTMDELFEYIVNHQLGFHDKPVFILNLEGFYDPVIDLIKKMKETEFLKGYDQSFIHFCPTVEQLMELLKSH